MIEEYQNIQKNNILEMDIQFIQEYTKLTSTTKKSQIFADFENEKIDAINAIKFKFCNISI